MYDVIVVGARCAGSPTAMLLARRGHRVLMVDRASFPSDTISTHFIQLPGMARLKRWGLLERVAATGCPPVTGGMLDIGGQQVEADFAAPRGIPGLMAPRRTVLDKILVDAAIESGAEVREGAFVDSLIFEDDRVAGIRGHTSEGEFEERARFVVGADGRNSMVGRTAGAQTYRESPVLGGGFYSYWSDVECKVAELYLYENRFGVAFPTNDGLTTIAIAFVPEQFDALRKDPDASVQGALDELGSLGERTRAGRRQEKLVPIANLKTFLRTAGGPGWALVGDAGYHKDPQPADGISDAFRAVEQLVGPLSAFLAGDISEEEALERYQKERDASAIPLLEHTVTMSSFDSSPMDRATAFLELQGLHAQETERLLSDLEPVG